MLDLSRLFPQQHPLACACIHAQDRVSIFPKDAFVALLSSTSPEVNATFACVLLQWQTVPGQRPTAHGYSADLERTTNGAIKQGPPLRRNRCGAPNTLRKRMLRNLTPGTQAINISERTSYTQMS